MGPGPGTWAPLSPDPVVGVYRLDSDRATTLLIGPEGGALSATDADGTEYVLNVPPDALLSDVELTLAPIVSSDNLGLDQVRGAAIEPLGLTFYGAGAQLTFSLPSRAAGAELRGFQVRALPSVRTRSGRGELGHAPLDVVVDGETITLQLPTPDTGGYGVGDDSGAFDPQAPSRTGDQALGAIAAAIDAARPSGDLPLGEIQNILRGWFDNSLLGDLDRGIADPDFGTEVLSELFRWLAEVEKWGLGDEGLDRNREPVDREKVARQKLHQLFDSLLRRASGRCDWPGEGGVYTARALARLARFAGLTDPQAIDADLLGRLERCLTFELRMTSTFTTHEAQIVTVTREAKIQLTLGPSEVHPARQVLRGVGPLKVAGTPRWIDTQVQCTGTFVSGTEVPFHVLEADLQLNLQVDPVPDATVTISFDPSESSLPTETFRIDCPDGSAPLKSYFWSSPFLGVYLPQMASPGFTLRAWGPGQMPTYAVKTYSRRGQDVADRFEEVSRYELVHTPRLAP